jgi:hypothetical protein
VKALVQCPYLFGQFRDRPLNGNTGSYLRNRERTNRWLRYAEFRQPSAQLL